MNTSTKSPLTIIAIIGLALAALILVLKNATGANATSPVSPTQPEPPIALLTDGTWSLNELTINGESVMIPNDTIPTLTIDGRNVSGSLGCNTFSGTAVFDRGSVTFNPLATTQKACLDQAMALENGLTQVYNNATSFTTTSRGQLLTVSNEDGSITASFNKVAQKTLYVGAETADCVGVAPQQCLLVKERVEDDYSFFYSNIAGFDYEPGFEYDLLVNVMQQPNPPADASSVQYELVEVVSKTAVATPPIASLVNGNWQLTSLTVEGSEVALPTGIVPTLTIDGSSVSGSLGCNSFTGTAEFDQQAASFGPLATTRKACPTEVTAVENAMSSLYQEVTSITTQQRGQELVLSNADGSTTATFSLAE